MSHDVLVGSLGQLCELRTVSGPTSLAVPDLNGVETGNTLNVANCLLEIVEVRCGCVVDVLVLPVPECVYHSSPVSNSNDLAMSSQDVQEGRHARSEDGVCCAVLEFVPTVHGSDAGHEFSERRFGVPNSRKKLLCADAAVETF